jgi:hypothetical protein
MFMALKSNWWRGMRRACILFGAAIVMVLLMACSRTMQDVVATPTTRLQLPTLIVTETLKPTDSPLAARSQTPAVASGTASLTGELYTLTGPGPIRGTVFYLTPARGPTKEDPPMVLAGPKAELGDVRGQSDDQGRIVLTDVPPGNYFLAVWAPYNWVLAHESETDLTPRLIVFQPDKWHDLGRIEMVWP